MSDETKVLVGGIAFGPPSAEIRRSTEIMDVCQRWTAQVSNIMERLRGAMPDCPPNADLVAEACRRLASLAAAEAARDEAREALDEDERRLLKAKARAEAAEATVEAMRAQKDGAYRERDQVVAVVARMACVLHWPAWLGRHLDKPGDLPWDEDWRNIVFVTLPSGQVSWHIHDSEVPLFDFLPRRDDPWDGHDTAEKYRRCAAPWPWMAIRALETGRLASPRPTPPEDAPGRCPECAYPLTEPRHSRCLAVIVADVVAWIPKLLAPGGLTPPGYCPPLERLRVFSGAPATPPEDAPRCTFPGDLDRPPGSLHTNHCLARLKWGDGECECGAASSPPATAKPASDENARLRESIRAQHARALSWPCVCPVCADPATAKPEEPDHA